MKKLFTYGIFIALVGYLLMTINYYNPADAAKYITNHAEKKSVGMCALYVRLAIKDGGCPTFFHPHSACEYDKFLPKLGFEEISMSNYKPMTGDIIVIGAVKGHEHGHIAMYNGKKWISDFVQRDMFGGSAYRQKGVEYHLYRRNAGWGIRSL